MRTLCVSLLFCILCAAGVCADDVYTKEGKRFKGTITQETEKALTLQTDAGTVIVNKSDVLHIERDKKTEEKKEPRNWYERVFMTFEQGVSSVTELYEKMSRNNWHYPRRKIKQFHSKLFIELNKIKVYQMITRIEAVEKFRDNNYRSFVFAVYMVLLLIVGMILTVIQRILYSIYCKIRGVKPRYDV